MNVPLRSLITLLPAAIVASASESQAFAESGKVSLFSSNTSMAASISSCSRRS